MSREIDERVVEMRFDNKQFESGVKESLGTIEKLKRSLDLKKAAASFDELGRSADKCDMSGLGRTVDMVSKKFSALETIAVGALLKIGSQAVTAGERLLKSLTVDQITSGWGKYADKTTAVQTIMAATGKSIDDVNRSLEKLIWFTDETSYSMTDMTSNIGKFTSQGVDLDTAVTAMEGISTWASLSGGSINEASRAMWNLSQALGAGAVKLQDWKSIETANMATKEFKEMAMEAAVATGDLTKSFDDAGNAIYQTSKGTKVTAANFSSTLSEAWFSSDALISVLNNYGRYADGIYELYNNLGEGVEKTTSEIIGDMKRLRGADDQTILDAGYTEEQIDLVRRLSEEVGGVGQKSFAAAQEAKTFKEVIDSVKEAVASGWSRTFETIFGNYEEAKVLWTDLANVLWDVFASGGAARNELLQEALSVSGLNNFKAALADTGVTMDALQAKVAEMGRVRGVNLDGLIKQYGSFDKVLQNGAISAQLLRKATNAAFRELGGNKIELLDELQIAIWAINDGVDGFSGREHLISAFWNSWEGVGALLSTVKDAFREIFPAKTADQIYEFARRLNELSARFKTFLTETKRGQALLTNLKNTFKGFFAVLDIAKQAVSALFRVVGPLIEQIFGLGEGALGVTGSLGEWLAKLDQTIKKNDTFFNVLSGIANVLGKVVGFIKDLAGKVGDKLELPSLDEFGKSIGEFFETFSKRAGNGGLDRIKAFIGRLKEMDGVSFKNIKAALKDFKENIINYFFDFEGAFGKFGTVFDNIGNKIKGVFENISGRIQAALASIGLGFSSAGDKVSTFTTNVKEKAKNDVDSLTKAMIGVKDKIFGVALEIRNKLADKIGIGEIFAVGLGTTMVMFTRKISKTLNSITSPLAGVGSVLDSWSKQLSAKAWTERSKALKNAGQAVLTIGAGILFLAMAMEKLNKLEDMGRGLKLLSALLGELIGTLTIIGASSIVIGKFSINAGSNLKKAGSAMLKIAIAVLLIAKALQSMEKLDVTSARRSMSTIEEFLAVFALVAIATNTATTKLGKNKFSRNGTSNLSQAGSAMLKMAASMILIATAMKSLDKLDPTSLNRSKAIIEEFFAVFALVALATNTSKVTIGKFSTSGTSNLSQAGSALFKMAASMLLISAALKSMEKLDPASMKHSQAVIEEFFAVFALIALTTNRFSVSGKGLFNEFSARSSSNLSQAGSAMFKMAASMLVIAAAFKLMEGLDAAAMKRSKAVIEEFFAIFALVTMFSGLSGRNAAKAGTMILLMSAALIPLSAVMVLLSNFVDPSGLDRALRAIEQILLIFGVLVKVTTFAGKSEGANKTIIALTVAIAALAASVAVLTLLDADRLNGAVAALSILMGMLGLVIKMTEHATKAVGVIAMITVAVVAIAGVLTVMSLLNVQSALANAAALSLVLLSMAAALEILDGVGKISASALLSMAVMEALVAGLAAIFWAMSELDVQPSIETAASLSILLLSMSAACLILSGVGMVAPAATAGVEVLATLVVAIGVLMAAISALTKDNPTVAEDLDRAIMVLEKIGAGIGSFIGGIIGGFAAGITSGLPEIGQNLSDFMKNANYFVSAAKNIDEASLDGIKRLGEALLVITGAELLDALTSWLLGDSSMADFGTQLAAFGMHLQAYASSVENLNTEDIERSADAAQALVSVADAIPKTGGLVGLFTGNSNMKRFGKRLVDFGESLNEYAEAVAGLDVDTITASKPAGLAVAEIAEAIPNSGGLVSLFAGGNNMKKFGERLVAFGQSLQDYGDAVDGLKVTSIVYSKKAGLAVAEIAEALPNEGGLLAGIVGDNDMDTFASKLKDFGKGLRDYAEAVNGLKVDAILASKPAALAIAEIADAIPNEGGLLAKIVGDNDMATFSEQFYNFGRALQRYSTAVLGLDVDAISAATIAGTSVIDMLNLIENSGGVQSWFAGEKDITGFGVQLDSFGNCLKIYSNAVTGLKTESINTSIDVATQLKTLADSITGDADKLVAFGEDISSFGEKVGTLDATKLTAVTAYIQAISELSTAISSIQTGNFASLADSFRSLGESGIGELVRSFSTSDSKLTSAINGMINTICRAASNGKAPVSNSMQDVATTMIGSFYRKALGITDSAALVISALCAALKAGSGSVSSAIQSVMSAAVGAVNNYYEKFYSAGVYAGQGFVLGIRSKLAAASTTGWNLGLAALEAARTAIKYGSPAKEFIDLGSIGVGDGFVIGMKSKKKAVENAGHDLGEASLEGLREALDAHSPGKETEEIGEVGAGGGVVVGIINSLPKVKAAAAKMGRTVVNTAKSEISKLGTDEEIKAVKDLTTEVKKSADVQQKATVKTYSVKNEAVDTSYQKSLDWIKREKEANRLSLEEEIAAYERMQARYIEGSKERIAIDKKLLELQNELTASYEKSMNWIEREKYYNRLTLVEELAAYKRVQSRYKAGTEEREKMDREVYRVEKEIYEAQKQYTADVQRVQEEANQKRLDLEQEYADKVSQVNQQLASDIQNLNDQYESALKSRTESLYQSYGLFDKVAEREEVSGAELLDNLQGQVEEFNSWTSSLGALSARGVNEDLIAELSNMGPSAISQIKALESMTDDELTRYVDLWTVKHVQAKAQATQELEGLRIETQNGIAQLRADAARELEEYRITWQQNMNQITVDANAELARLRQDFEEKVGLIKKDTDQEMKEMAESARQILEEAGWDETGHQIVAGINEGIKEEKPKFIDTLTQMALDGVQAVNDTLEIESPSKVLRKSGNFAGLGLVLGLKDYAGKAYDAGSYVAEQAKDGVGNAIRTVSDYLNGDMEARPTIRPVMDLTDVASGMSAVDSMFNTRQMLALAAQASYGFSINEGNRELGVHVDNSGIIQELRSLRGDMGEMGDKIMKMQMILDTGVLVGGIIDGVDSALGHRQVFKGRGI